MFLSHRVVDSPPGLNKATGTTAAKCSVFDAHHVEFGFGQVFSLVNVAGRSFDNGARQKTHEKRHKFTKGVQSTLLNHGTRILLPDKLPKKNVEVNFGVRR